MKKGFIKVLGVVLASTTILAACGDKGTEVKLATGGNTGTYYSYGTAIGQIIGAKEDISFNIQSTGASKANIQLIDAGEVDMAIVQNDVMDYAFNGSDLFVEDGAVTGFSAMAAVYAEVVQIVANPSSGIKTIADLKGKNVSVGDAGSGVEFNAKQILEAYGISFDDINKQNLSFAASADAYKDSKIDAFFATAGAPTTAIMDLVTSKDILILTIEDDIAEKLMESYPFYTVYDIPGGTYTGVEEDIKTLAVKATFIVSNDLDETTVYNMTKALFENKEEITSAHAKGNELDVDYAVSGISIPFHKGAEKYFREIGALK
ncbi:MAG TPA: TAXI family TRAP transporter solute-binding subunit [Proteiniclasticum sp.]|nr:TAXI family TRAP transporter solute-binding subunit [Proteiniclasticum sp.]